MSTFNKIYKKIANNGNDSDYQAVANVGVNGVDLAVMKGASSSNDGEIGLVPKCGKGNQWKYLRGDGSWQYPDDTTYTVFSSSNDGLVPKTDKSNYFLCGNGKWGYPWLGLWDESDKSKSLCLGSGDDHLSTVTIPVASSSSHGLMHYWDKAVFDNFFYPGMILFHYEDVSFSVASTNNLAYREFNNKFTSRVYSDGGRKFDVFKLAAQGKVKVSYEPRFTGCSYGNIEQFNNGTDLTYSTGWSNGKEYVDYTFYIQGTCRNISGETHSMLLRSSVDFYASVNTYTG